MVRETWEEYLKFVQDNNPWDIANRWAKFTVNAVLEMDPKIDRTREYLTVATDLMKAVEEKDTEKIDWLAEVIEPKTSMADTSFFTDGYLYENDAISSNSHNMAVTGFSSCLSILATRDYIKYKSPLWENNEQMSVYPELIDEVHSADYMAVFRQVVLKN